MLKNNVGTVDRLARVVLGAVLMSGFLYMPSGLLAWIFLIVGIIVLATGLLGSCLLYTILGKSTCAVKDA